ncbi:MAG: ABC transporter permease [Blastocatellales bacterium]|nr:ABC transporter permease [Blastocatellales bacterium]
MQSVWQDFRFGLRMLSKRPAFLIVSVMTLGLGIGANTAIFSVVNSVLLRPLAYPEPERLVAFRYNESMLDLDDVRAQTSTLEALGGITQMALDYTGGGEPVQAMSGLVTADFFGLLGARAQLGRLIAPEENRFGAERLVVLGHRFWQSQFGGDPGVVGRAIDLSGESYTIVGVMSESFRPPRETPDLFVSLPVGYPVAARERGVHFLRTYARLKSGVTIAQAQAEMAVIDRRLAEAHPALNRTRQTVLFPLQDRLVSASRDALWILFGAVGCVLLVACANFANLLLARAASREQELTIRAALGAGRARIMRQLLTESVTIALLGGAAGLVLALWGLDLLVALKPQNLPRFDEISIDGRVLAFTFAVAIATGLIFGLIPAWQSTRMDVTGALKEGGRSSTAGTGRRRLRSALVVIELALAVVLLAGAGLLIRSLWELRRIAPGFDPANVVSMRIELPESRYGEIPRQTEYRERVIAAINTLPGVEAAMISEVPLSGNWLDHDFIIDGRPPMEPGTEPSLQSRSVMGDYLKVMRIPLLAGRDLTPDDRAGRPMVGVVNEAMVREHFPNEDPIGKRVRWVRSSGPPQWIEIVGVAADVKHFGLAQPDLPAIYWPYAQSVQPWKRWMQIVARTQSRPEQTTAAIKRQIWSVDPMIPLTRVETMDQTMSASYAERQFNMLLLGIFAGVALLLAGVGIYGVMSYAVEQRTHEIGIRLALGARRADVLRLVLGQGAALIGGGLALGVAAAAGLVRMMRSLLYATSPYDPWTFAGVVALLAAVALLACYVPARRATRVDPIIALRYE